jgi:Bacterial SH3 domain
MKWFLQFLSLGSAVLYTLLVVIDNRIPDVIADNTDASEAHSNQHRLSAWGPYLPNRSPGQDRQASTTIQPTHQQNVALAPKPYRQSPRQYFDDQPTSDNEGARIEKRLAALPITGDSFEPSASPVPKGENEEANWVFVIRGATVHSGPSVSAPTVRFYSVGTELQLIDYQQGWFQVSDPVTSQRGWIYEKYYLEAIRGPGQMVAALQEPAKPQQEVVKARNPTPLKRAKKIGPRLAKKVQPGIASAARYRYETVASILDKALRP